MKLRKTFLCLPLPLITILVIAFFLRLHGLFYALPLPYAVGDECTHYLGSLHLLANKTIIVPFSRLLGPYLAAPLLALTMAGLIATNRFSSIEELKRFILLNPGIFLPVVRLMTVFFGLVNIYLLYQLVLKIWRQQKIALLSALLLSTCLLHLQLTQFSRGWALVLTFDLLTLILILEKPISLPSQKKALAIAISAGLALAAHRSGIVAYLFVFWLALQTFLKYPFKKWLGSWLPSFLILLSFPLLILLLTLPQARFGHPIHLNALFQFPPQIVSFLKPATSQTIFFLKTLLRHEPTLVIFGALGFFVSRSHPLKLKQLTLLLALLTFAFFYATARSLLPLIVFLTIFSAYALCWLTNKLPQIKLIILSLAFLPNIIFSLRFNYLLHQRPTFAYLSSWLKQSISQKDSVAIRENGSANLIPSPTTAAPIKEKNPHYFQAAYRHLQEKDYYNVVYLNDLENHQINSYLYLQQNPPQYIVDIYFNPKLQLDFSQLEHTYQPINHFYPRPDNQQAISYLVDNMVNPWPASLLFNIQRPGPYIDIYQIML